MRSKWRQTTLGEVMTMTSGGTPRKDRVDYWGGSIPWASAKDMKSFFLDDAEDHITDVGLANGTRLAGTGNVLILVRGMTLLNEIPICVVRRPMAFNQDVKALHANDAVAPEFLPYLLLSKKDQLLASVELAGHGTGRLNSETLRTLRIRLPNIKVQHAIASVLGRLDDKIELNHHMSETLEKVAAALFKSWFVDFDPVHAKAEGRNTGLPNDVAALFPSEFEDSELGEIPKGWAVRPLDHIATYLNGVASQKYSAAPGTPSSPVIKIKELNGGVTAATCRASTAVPEKFFVDDGDVLFSWSGTLLIDVWCGGRGVLNQHLFKVSSEDYPAWLAYHATKHFLARFRQIAAGKATTMGHIKRRHLTDAKLVLPGGDVVRRCTKLVTRLFDLRTDALVQARKLAQLRDTLLPKLVSGELEVPVAEGQTEAALA